MEKSDVLLHWSKKVIHDLGDSLSNNISLSVGIHGTYPTVPLTLELIRCIQTQVAVKHNLIGTTLQTLVTLV